MVNAGMAHFALALLAPLAFGLDIASVTKTLLDTKASRDGGPTNIDCTYYDHKGYRRGQVAGNLAEGSHNYNALCDEGVNNFHDRQLQGEGSFCSNGFPGIDSSVSEYCCDRACGQCGGQGCGSYAEGHNCCTSSISDSGVMCEDVDGPPCIIQIAELPPSSTPTSESICTNGFQGVESSSDGVCCHWTCGQCGGSGCNDFAEDQVCCKSAVVALNVMCDDVDEPPCLVNPVSVSPSPDYPMPVSAPTPVMKIPTSCTDDLPSIRFATRTSFNGRMYMEGTGCATMTDLYKTRLAEDGVTSLGPIYVLDDDNKVVEAPTEFTGKWLMTAELHVTTGAILYCRGSEVGGDCDELRIQSNGPLDFHEIRGHGGSLYFESTVVTSWDTNTHSPQEVYEGGRSFLNCVSEYESNVDCDGQPKNDIGECRMDIINSEMGYLGWFDSESYGLTWKVRGFCKNKSNPEIFDTTNVYGDIKGSEIHHMYYGMYSYGHQGGVWTDNIMRDNHQYGFDPHDDSDYLTIAGNTVYNNFNHGIIASKRCNNVEIYDNEVYNGGPDAAGIFLHRSSDSCKVYDNNVHDMPDAGMALLESFDAEIYDNTFTNVEFGIRISLGGGNNYVHDNVFDTCTKYGIFTYQGSDAPEQTVDGRPGENLFINNHILNTKMGVKLKEGDNNVLTGNVFTGTEEMEFFNSQATQWIDNEVPSTACSDFVTEDDGFDVTPSTFTSDSRGVPAACD